MDAIIMFTTVLSFFAVTQVRSGAQAGLEQLYLKGPGHPRSVLDSTIPQWETVTNLDRHRNDDPGLTLQSGGIPVREPDDAKHQAFVFDASEHLMTGPATLVLWVASGNNPVGGEVVAHLLDCDSFGIQCEVLGRGSADVAAGETGIFSPVTVQMDFEDHEFGPDRTLKLDLTVHMADDLDLLLGYDALATPSALSFSTLRSPPPAPTTTIAPPRTVPVPSPAATTPSIASPPAILTVIAPTSPTTATTSTTVGSTTTTAAFAEGNLSSFVFSFSGAAGPTGGFDAIRDVEVLGRMVALLTTFGTTMRTVSPWLLSLAVFSAALAMVAERLVETGSP